MIKYKSVFMIKLILYTQNALQLLINATRSEWKCRADIYMHYIINTTYANISLYALHIYLSRTKN